MFCALFGLSKQAYYQQISHKENKEVLYQRARTSVLQLRRNMPRLGTRKLHYLLKQQEIFIGRDQLFRGLRTDGLLITKRKKYTITTNSKHHLRRYPNLVKEINLTHPEQLWVADITYLDTSEGNVYLHLITDAYSKRVMGYELCNNMEAASTLKALQMAVKSRQYNGPLIHHSDRGLQYCSRIYTSYLLEKGITVSMTENGDPYENAVAERMNGILKSEFGLSDKLDDLKGASKQTRESISTYNQNRPHLSCSMLTPMQMHNQSRIKLKTYKRKSSDTLQGI